MPFIEDNKAALDLYLQDEAAFWARLWDEEDDFREGIFLLLVDGGHRHFVTKKLGLEKMNVCFLRPTISFGELVCALLNHTHTPLLNHTHLASTLSLPPTPYTTQPTSYPHFTRRVICSLPWHSPKIAILHPGSFRIPTRMTCGPSTS